MSTAIYTIEVNDTPNSGRLKINTSLSNLQESTDETAALLSGIGDPIGTTNTKEMTNKTLISDNISGSKNNVIQVSRLDVKDDLFEIHADTGYTAADVDESSIYELHILGTNGLESLVSGGKIYLRHPEHTVINRGTQTMAVAVSGVTTGYTFDVNGYGLIRTGLSVGTHASLATDKIHAAGTDNVNPIVCTLKNEGTAGLSYKLVNDDDTDYWFMKRTNTDDFIIGHRGPLDASDDAVFFIDDAADTDSLTLQTSKKFGINNTSPSYNLHVGSGPGIGIDSTTIYMNGATSRILNTSGSVRISLSGVQVFDANINQNIGLCGVADDNYDVKVNGSQLITEELVIMSGIVASGLAALDGGIQVNTDKFLVDTSGNTNVAGTMSISGLTTVEELTVNGDLTLGAGATSYFDIIQPTVSSGITFKSYAGTDSVWLRRAGYLHVGQGFPTGVTERFAVNGDIKFINKSSHDNYFKFSETNSANYFITGSPTTYQKPLYLQITGDTSNHKALYLQQGKSNDPTALYTRLLVDNDRTAVNTGDVAGNVGREIFNIYNEDYLPFHFKINDMSSMNINSYFSSGWKYSKNTTGSHVGAVRIGLDAPLASGYFSIATAGYGSAGGAITWADPGIRIDQNGNVGIKKNPTLSWELDVNGDIRSTGNMYSEGAITASGILTCNTLDVSNGSDTSIETQGGITGKSTYTAQFAAGYAASTPAFKSIIPTVSGVGLAIYRGATAAAQIVAGVDPDGSTRRVEMFANPDGYAYAHNFKAGYWFEAGKQSQVDNAQSNPQWCPVPYLVFSKSYAGQNITVTGINETIRVPQSGIYRLMWSWQLLTDTTTTDPKRINVQGKIGGVTVYEQLYYEDVGATGFVGFIKNKKLGGTCMGLISLSETSSTNLVITYSNNDRVSAYNVYGVTLEFIGESEFNAYS
jgi:hypothetical protein